MRTGPCLLFQTLLLSRLSGCQSPVLLVPACFLRAGDARSRSCGRTARDQKEPAASRLPCTARSAQGRGRPARSAGQRDGAKGPWGSAVAPVADVGAAAAPRGEPGWVWPPTALPTSGPAVVFPEGQRRPTWSPHPSGKGPILIVRSGLSPQPRLTDLPGAAALLLAQGCWCGGLVPRVCLEQCCCFDWNSPHAQTCPLTT